VPLACAALAVAALALPAPASAAHGDAWIDRVVAFVPGPSAGFGADALPRIVLGPPHGLGALQGSVDVVSLGSGGSITVAFRDNVVIDGPGDDLVVFENAFHSGSEDGPIFTEYGIVSLSADGKTWHEVPYDAQAGTGLAGRAPVFASPGNGIDALAPVGGGDRFDLADVGLAFARFVRIVDAGDAIDDVGNHVPVADKAGFDLDAVGAIHSTTPGVVTGTVTAGGAPITSAHVRLEPADGTKHMRRATHPDGSFRFRPVLPSGSYRIVARRRGVGRAEATFDVDSEHLQPHLDLTLE
jgi:Carboxypeptidase regulatory-like domain